MATPRLSIGLPVYNGAQFLCSALDSILNQDYTDLELIISDNASTDQTPEICRRYAAKDRRISYHRNPENIGASGNYNRVFELARGEFFKWASHDDQCHPSFVRRCLERLLQEPASTVLVHTRADIIDEFGRFQEHSSDAISSSSSWPHIRLAKVISSVRFGHALWGVIRAEALRKTRLMGVIEADLVLLAELALQGELFEIPDVLYSQRRHPGCAIPTHQSAKALLAWHDPSRADDRILLPHWERVYVQYIKGVRHARLRSVDRLLCYGTVPVVSYGRRFLKWTRPFRHRYGLRRKKVSKGTQAYRQLETSR